MGQNPGGTSATMDYVNLTSRGDGQNFGDALLYPVIAQPGCS